VSFDVDAESVAVFSGVLQFVGLMFLGISVLAAAFSGIFAWVRNRKGKTKPFAS
jgi:hypothetical protein